VVVTTPAGDTATLPSGFTILTPPSPPAISITGIVPSTGYNNGTVSITNLSGSGFTNGANVTLRMTGQQDINATNVVIASSQKITCKMDLNGKQAGTWDVVVTTPAGDTATLPSGFTILTPPSPTVVSINSITPSQGYNNGSIRITNLSGSNFVSSTKVALRMTGQSDINATSVVVSNSQKITCYFSLKGKQAGSWDVVVTTPAGQTATLPGGFNILATPAKLSVSSITPNTAKRGTTVTITSLSGSGFQEGATVKLQRTGKPDILGQNTVVESASKITCSFTVPATTTTGYWSVRVTNPDGGSAVKNYAFIIR
jgi:hypothetical protein